MRMTDDLRADDKIARTLSLARLTSAHAVYLGEDMSGGHASYHSVNTVPSTIGARFCSSTSSGQRCQVGHGPLQGEVFRNSRPDFMSRLSRAVTVRVLKDMLRVPKDHTCSLGLMSSAPYDFRSPLSTSIHLRAEACIGCQVALATNLLTQLIRGISLSARSAWNSAADISGQSD